jgi:hypothetical protein
MTLDPVGNVSLILQVAILFLLVLGLPLSRGQGSKKNFVRHGYSTLAALVLHSILIFVVMIPTLIEGTSEFSTLTFLALVTVWSHAVLGTLAWILGIVVIGAWLWKGPSKMTCTLWKKWMMPTFIIWVISIVNGALVHIFSLL